MRTIITLALILASGAAGCAHAVHVGPDNDVALYQCDDDGVGAALEQAVIVWPDVAPIVERLEVFCVDVERLRSASICGRAVANEETSCAAWPGSPGLLGAPARIYSGRGPGLSTKANVLHELQHLRPAIWAVNDGCAFHLESCGWDKQTLKWLTSIEPGRPVPPRPARPAVASPQE